MQKVITVWVEGFFAMKHNWHENREKRDIFFKQNQQKTAMLILPVRIFLTSLIKVLFELLWVFKRYDKNHWCLEYCTERTEGLFWKGLDTKKQVFNKGGDFCGPQDNGRQKGVVFVCFFSFVYRYLCLYKSCNSHVLLFRG